MSPLSRLSSDPISDPNHSILFVAPKSIDLSSSLDPKLPLKRCKFPKPLPFKIMNIMAYL
jgi:hypothetical protein